MESHLISNGIVLVMLFGTAATIWAVRRSRLWSSAFVSLWHRRRLALLVTAVYVGVALLDSVAWVGGDSLGGDTVSLHEARSVIDRVFGGSQEKSYSAPLATTEFYGGRGLRYPGGHWLGTDMIGRDVFYLTLKGARVALLIGGLTSLIAIPLALLFGISAGYFGGRIDDVVFFLMTTLASMPGLLLLIALIMVMGKSTLAVCVALAVTGWVGFCRVSRGETLKLRELEFVSAARALGVSEFQILTRHILPNLMHLVIITFVLMFSGLVLSEAILSWLGIGVDGSWGQMIDQARNELSRDPIVWWNIAASGAALFGLILAVNFVGDALRDVLDPRTVKDEK
ncbi:MAG: ABC transporter permease [Myxococcota bacterium]|nr:ABC transporter permease [Myxococcota bacterium]